MTYSFLCRLKHCFSLHPDTTPPQSNHTVTPTHIEPEQYNTWNRATISRKLLKMDVLTFEICWALNNEIKKQVTSSWPVFIQLPAYNSLNYTNIQQRVYICVLRVLPVLAGTDIQNSQWSNTYSSPTNYYASRNFQINSQFQNWGEASPLCIIICKASYIISQNKTKIYLLTTVIKLATTTPYFGQSKGDHQVVHSSSKLYKISK
jgi:hypothetical protein